MRRSEFEEKIEESVEPLKNLKVDVIGHDNKHFMAFIKKKDRGAKPKGGVVSNRLKG